MDDIGYEAAVRRDKRLLCLLLAWSVTLVVFILGPVFLDFSPKLEIGELLPYSLWDGLEQCEPFISLPLNYFILSQSGLMNPRNTNRKPKSSAERTLVKLLFLVGGALYVNGHGMHFGYGLYSFMQQAAMPTTKSTYPLRSKIAKRAIEQAQAPFNCFQKTRYNETADPACLPAYNSYMFVRGHMEHIVGHYIYLAGAILISVAHTLAFRSDVHFSATPYDGEMASSFSFSDTLSASRLNIRQKCAFYFGAVLYALLVAGVSIEFPKGFYVVISLMVLHGSAIVAMAVASARNHALDIEAPNPHDFSSARGGTFEFCKATLWPPAFDGRALVLQYYLAAYVIAALPIVCWVVYAGGFIDRESSGMKL